MNRSLLMILFCAALALLPSCGGAPESLPEPEVPAASGQAVQPETPEEPAVPEEPAPQLPEEPAVPAEPSAPEAPSDSPEVTPAEPKATQDAPEASLNTPEATPAEPEATQDAPEASLNTPEATPAEPAESRGAAVSIVNTALGQRDIAFAQALEKIWEDDENEYYFSCIISPYILVTYEDGSQEDVAAALAAGRVTPADLDRFGISYLTMPRETQRK